MELQVIITFQLKVELRHTQPPVWRRFLVDSEIDLHQLHQALQIIMGWAGVMTHRYEKGSVCFISEKESIEWVHDELFIDTATKSLKSLLSYIGNKLTYIYDDVTRWEHEIHLEKVLANTQKLRIPLCLEGERCAPPEEIEGVDQYGEMLQIICDPSDNRYEKLWVWLGECYDPEYIDLSMINDQLQDIQ